MSLALCPHSCDTGINFSAIASRDPSARHAQLYLKDRKIPWVIHGIDLSQGSHGLYMGLN